MNHLPTASTLDPKAAHDYVGAGRPDGEETFERAMRHSRHVRRLRVALPVGLAVLLIGLALATWLDPLRMLYRLPGEIGPVVISGTKITMSQPKLSGYTRDSRWYELNARAAAQDLRRPDFVELQEIRAKLEMQDKTTMHLTAADGLFDRKAGVLTLSRDIVLTSSSGLRVDLVHAVVDTNTGNIVSDRPVEVRSQDAQLNGNRLEVTSSGEVVRFDGGVTMILQPAKGGGAAGSAQQ
jgi:lipopolysaccharide export system protein LptC